MVWGSGEGGRVVKEKLERLGLDITYFVDTNYEEIIERYGKRVKSPQELNKETDYVIVSIVKVYTEIESYLRKVKGYQDNDYFIYLIMKDILKRTSFIGDAKLEDIRMDMRGYWNRIH